MSDNAETNWLRPFRNLRLRHKIGLSLLVAALLPVLVASWVSVSVVFRGLDRGLQDETARQLHVGLNLLLRNVERLGAEAVRLSLSDTLEASMDHGPVGINEALAREATHMPSSLVQVASAEGIVQAQRVVGGVIGRFDDLGVESGSSSIRAGQTYERRVTIVAIGDHLVVRAVAPVVDDSFKLLGVVVISLPLDAGFAEGLKAALGTDVLIFAGTTNAGTASSSFLGPYGEHVTGIALPPTVAGRIAKGQTQFVQQEISANKYELGYTPILDLDGQRVGIFAVAVDRAPLIDARRGAFRSLGLGALGAIVFALGLAGLISRRITRPLGHLHEGAIAIARGDLDHQIELTEGDEIGDLATAFSHMTSALKENQRRLAARMREIVALHDAGRAVSSVIEPDLVLKKIVDAVSRVLHVKVCALWLVDVDDDGRSAGSSSAAIIVPPGDISDDAPRLELRLGAARAKRSDMRIIAQGEAVAELVAPLLEIARETAETRTAVRVDRVSTDSHRREAAVAAGVTGSLVAVPLERKGVVLGVIIIGRARDARPFSEADANLLSTFADQAATAIENASLYDEVRSFNEELEAKVKLRTAELTAMNAELGRALTELRETQAQLVLSERLAGLGQLVAGVAHEINSPSAAIRGTVDAFAGNVARLTQLSRALTDLELSREQRERFLSLVDQAGPRLADHRIPSPAAVRRKTRSLRKELQANGLDTSAATECARRLAEIGAEPELLESLTTLLAEGSGARAQTLVAYLAESVYLHRGALTIKTAIDRIQRIVSTLKSYSHLDEDPSRVKSDIHDGIESTLVMFDHLLGRGINITRTYGKLPSVGVYVDELNQVWTNLIHNAIQALQGEGELTIETSSADDGVVVRIIDSGPGIPADVMPRIFEPFFTTKERGEGSGLGLGIVRQIIEKHSGKVKCYSEPGRTCFEVWLPKHVKDQTEAAEASG